jgi:hypothetical protein
MKAFTSFLVEASTEDKLTHLEHPEDHPIKSGEPGFHHAFNTLKTTHEALQNQDSGTRIMTKFDGAPSIVFGHDEQGRFFVASKAAFNKNPKVNYTEADIEHNHGHAPGLVKKLKAALKYLPKVAPRAGVYQGDFLYNKADNDVSTDGKNFKFKPQLIEYSAPVKSELGQKINRAKIGFYVHTAYTGHKLSDMKANYTPDLSGFRQNPDVHLHTWDQGFDAKKAKYTPEEMNTFKTEMNKAGNIFKTSDRGALFAPAHDADLSGHLSTYVNHAVRTNTPVSVAGLQSHIRAQHTKGIEAVKQDKTKQAKTQAMQAVLDKVKNNKRSIEALLKMHEHFQKAKDAMLPALTRGDTTGYKYSINGHPSGPEGFVAVTRNNRPTKLVNRGFGGFSQANLQKGGFGK